MLTSLFCCDHQSLSSFPPALSRLCSEAEHINHFWFQSRCCVLSRAGAQHVNSGSIAVWRVSSVCDLIGWGDKPISIQSVKNRSAGKINQIIVQIISYLCRNQKGKPGLNQQFTLCCFHLLYITFHLGRQTTASRLHSDCTLSFMFWLFIYVVSCASHVSYALVYFYLFINYFWLISNAICTGF